MTSKITTSRKALSARAAWVSLGWWLGGLDLWRLRVLGHGVGDVGGHSGEANGCHIGLGHVERGVHCTGRAVGSTVLHAAIHRGLGISRVFRSVRGVGTVHGELRELLEGSVLWGCSLNTLD